MIAPSNTLFRYVCKNYLLNFMVLLLILLGIVYIFDTIELLRRAARITVDPVPFPLILSMAALKLPEVGQTMLPFAVLFSAIYTCWKFNKTSEIVVMRASGLSVWQILMPMMAAALAIGVIETAVINPVSSIFLSRYGQMETQHFQKDSNLVTVSRTGIWLRQPTDTGYALIHSEGFDQKEWQLTKVTVFFFDDKDKFQRRIDSPVAFLRDGHWDFMSAVMNERTSVWKRDVERLQTELTAYKIEESFAPPETISFWQIPEYIKIMEETGFPATRLHIHFQSLLAEPFLFAAMILLAATFSLRPTRFGGTGTMITLGVLAGFFIFFMESMLQAFGISQKIPVYLAAWTPAIVSLLLGTTALLHLEDG